MKEQEKSLEQDLNQTNKTEPVDTTESTEEQPDEMIGDEPRKPPKT